MTTNNNYGMSFFTKPITNKWPKGTVSPFWVYQYLRSPEAKADTLNLRAIGKVLWGQHDEAT